MIHNTTGHNHRITKNTCVLFYSDRLTAQDGHNFANLTNLRDKVRFIAPPKHSSFNCRNNSWNILHNRKSIIQQPPLITTWLDNGLFRTFSSDWPTKLYCGEHAPTRYTVVAPFFGSRLQLGRLGLDNNNTTEHHKSHGQSLCLSTSGSNFCLAVFNTELDIYPIFSQVHS